MNQKVSHNLFDNLCALITTVVVIQSPHASVFGIRKKKFCDLQQRIMMGVCIVRHRIFTDSKTYATTICGIIFHCISGKMGACHQALLHQPAHTIAITINQCITAAICVYLTTATMVIREKANLGNPHHTFYGWYVVSECCVESLVM